MLQKYAVIGIIQALFMCSVVHAQQGTGRLTAPSGASATHSSATVPSQKERAAIPVFANAEVQAFLRALSSPELEDRQKLFPTRTEATFTEADFKEKLREIEDAAGGPHELVRQLLLFSADAKDMREAMLAGVIVESLEISQDDITSALLPYLETSNASVLKEVREWLGGLDYNRASKQYDFSRYENILREKKQNPSPGLIRYMYAHNPEAAVLLMARVYGGKATETKLAAQLKGDPKPVLQSFAERPEWWAHLYVASVLEKDPLLRTPELMEILEKDTHPIVQEKVSKLIEEMEPKPAVVHPFQH